jgi:hypothetical protein
MMRLTTLLLVLTCFTTGCHTRTVAPGAVGKVVDAETGNLVRGARITRSPIPGTFGVRPGLPPEGIPAVTTLSDRNGSFDLPPVLETQIAFMYLRNPAQIAGTFIVSADGYATNELHGFATPSDRWRVHFGRVPLKKLADEALNTSLPARDSISELQKKIDAATPAIHHNEKMIPLSLKHPFNASPKIELLSISTNRTVTIRVGTGKSRWSGKVGEICDNRELEGKNLLLESVSPKEETAVFVQRWVEVTR